ncbi:hypothetical protein NDU88_009400 [Pleurodeles waltl]|uniref:Receptor ligand binding region domain-containing protein n=1 Tax=Pleurodeles waltl TaxID=8319 RepID=A0AAV7PUW4_PLEWA|nr:hypothetical protein NDU88_009400 [Pleurodeles waltl]
MSKTRRERGFAASVPDLSDKIQFPSFLRTTPSDIDQAYGLARLVIHFGWTWVGILAEDSDYGLQGSQVFYNQLQEAGYCAAFYKFLPLMISGDSVHGIVQTIRASTAKVIMVFSTIYVFAPIMDALARDGVQGKVWLASDGWTTINTVLNEPHHKKILQGTIGFSPKTGKIPGLDDFLYKIHPFRTPEDIFITAFWEEIFSCQWDDTGRKQTSVGSVARTKDCTGKENLKALNGSFYSEDQLWEALNIYNAVYAIAHALHTMQPCHIEEGSVGNNRICNFQPWKVKMKHY